MKWKILQEPYPFDNSIKKVVLSSLFFGLFIFLFLFFFQPFGLTNYQSEHKTIQLLGYGLVTSFCLFSANFFFRICFPVWFHASTWTVLKNILFTLFVFFLIGTGNLLFSVSQGFLPLSIDGFLFYQSVTLLVGVFPVVLSTFLVYNRRLNRMVKEAQGLNNSLSEDTTHDNSVIQIPSLNKSEKINIELDCFLAAKAVENYVELYSFQEGKLEKKIVRNTLKNIEDVFYNSSSVQRCHRSYLVNLLQVDNFLGNAQGLRLNFNPTIELIIPVSRAYVGRIKNFLQTQ